MDVTRLFEVTELLDHVYEFLEPSWHFALARTCKSIYYRSERVLGKHRGAYKDSRIASDRYPQTLLRLFHSASCTVGPDAIEAWHVRELEIWGSRRSWDEWRSWELSPSGTVSLTRDQVALSLPFAIGELEYHLERLESVMSGVQHDIACQRVRDGEDGFFKMVLISLLPRLKALKFVERPHDGHTSFTWLKTAISWSIRNRTPWPPGFLSLRTVAVGVPTVAAQAGSDGISARVDGLAKLLRLPNIVEVYYRNLEMEYHPELEYLGTSSTFYDLPPGSSSVKTIILDRIRGDSLVFREVLCAAPAALESMIIRGEADTQTESDQIAGYLTESPSSASIKNFLYYNPELVLASHLVICKPMKLKQMANLRIVSICVQDIVNQASGNLGFPETHIQATHDDVVREFKTGLPRSIEAVAFCGLEYLIGLGEEKAHVTDIVDDGIVGMLESGNYPKLKMVFVDGIERFLAKKNPKGYFQKAVEAGAQHGVHIHTMTGKDDPEEMTDFPSLPDRHDLKSALLPKRDPSWFVNSFTGEWTAPYTSNAEDVYDFSEFADTVIL